MAQPKYDSNTGMPVYSVQTDQPAYLCKEDFDCTDCTTTMQAVFSNTDGSDCDCVIFGSDSAKISDITGINGTHTLTETASGSCVWQASLILNAVTYDYYSGDTTCSGTPSFSGGDSATMTLEYTGGQWLLYVTANTPLNQYVFYATNTDDECPDGMAFTDTSQCAGSPTPTATVTEL